MGGWPRRPVVYEVNTATWLSDLSTIAGRRVGLADVPACAWDRIAIPGVDAIWLMGVWERSPAGVAVFEQNPPLWGELRAALPDLAPEDIIGSPYCVRRYVVDEIFGGPEALRVARDELARRGKRLILDYVPNHLAEDHPWTTCHPEWFIAGEPSDLAEDPASWVVLPSGRVVARARDPLFGPWPDVVQLDAFQPEVRTATTETLCAIAAQCDGIRCDMAMLLMNHVFGKTWCGRVGPKPSTEFWATVIAGLRVEHPDTVLFAETYWGLEHELQHQGFEFCYDKRLYDRIVDCAPNAIRDHLRADVSYQSRLLRFVENHDECRVANLLPPNAVQAAAVIVATLPGAVLWHEGQFERRRTHAPVVLRRRRCEVPDLETVRWYHRFLGELDSTGIATGEWRLLEAEGSPDNETCDSLLCWSWCDAAAGSRHVVAVNMSPAEASGRLRLSWPDLDGNTFKLLDLVNDTVYERCGAELRSPGLFVHLGPWQSHVFSLTAATS
jgi:hypothetical protein